MFTVIKMEPNNRMVRVGFGQHEGNWFFRIDVWYYGLRIAKRT